MDKAQPVPAVTAMGHGHPTNPGGCKGLKEPVQLVHRSLRQFEPK